MNCKKLTKLDDDFAKVVRMSCPTEESNVANCAIMLMFAPENILLNVGHGLHGESYSEHYNTSNISSGAKLGLRNLLLFVFTAEHLFKHTCPYWVTFGELRRVTGNETDHTQII
jgi:hypothetical protein